ncbi:MAG: XRE family transcriptional regulator [bacterium]
MTTESSIEQRISANLKGRREALGLSLSQLAERSGVSKAMIGKVETGVSSPTAGLLGRLCAGLGVTLSTLMNSVEAPGSTHFPAHTQPSWRDPETGLQRTLVAAMTSQSGIEIARLTLPAGTVVEYALVPATPIRQHIYMLAGTVNFTIGGESTLLSPGDCLFAVIDRPTRFEVPASGPAEYLVIQEPA